jgi:hypothetical protein
MDGQHHGRRLQQPQRVCSNRSRRDNGICRRIKHFYDRRAISQHGQPAAIGRSRKIDAAPLGGGARQRFTRANP